MKSTPGALLIIASLAEHFTQSVVPEVCATGRDDLEAAGDKWTYFNRRFEAGNGTLYRTSTVLTGHEEIGLLSSVGTRRRLNTEPLNEAVVMFGE